jgi:hypothetical protein
MSDWPGQQLANAPDLTTYLHLETEATPADVQARFKEIALLAREFLALCIDETKARYQLPLGWMQAKNRDLWGFNPAKIVAKLSPENRGRLDHFFSGENQLNKGAVWLDASHSFSVSGLNYEHISTRLADDPGILFYLAVAAPALETLLSFMDIRHGSPLLRSKKYRLEDRNGLPQYDSRRANAAWFEQAPERYASLGVNANEWFAQVKSVSHFFGLPREKRHRLLEGMLKQIRESIAHSELVEYLRAERVQAAVQTYYRLSGKKRQPVPRRRFLKKAHEWLLSAYFEGSWLQFLEYISEEAAEDDYVSGAIPKPRVLMPLNTPAGMTKLPPTEQQRLLDSLDPAGIGIRTRLSLARDFWAKLVKSHEQQKPGMISLWGLVEDSPFSALSYRQDEGDGVYNPGLFQKRLPESLIQRIETLFGRETAPQHPTARTITLSPYYSFCTHLNPALSFWHGVGLTLWFLTQGPYSRTDIPGMPDYYQRQLDELKEFGCPVDPGLFRDLGKVKVVSRGNEIFTITISIFSSETATKKQRDQKRGKASEKSFLVLKEIYLRHLHTWTERYFEPFWKDRYRRKVAECGQLYNRLRETTGREPTPAKFVKQNVVDVINEYFGGDVYRLLEALGEPLPKGAKLRDEHLITSVETLKQAATAFALQELKHLDERLRMAFVEMAIRYCRLWEGRGKPPVRSTFTSSYYYQEICRGLGENPEQDSEQAWAKFSTAVEIAVRPALRI